MYKAHRLVITHRQIWQRWQSTRAFKLSWRKKPWSK